jgi:isochorismate synthase
MQLFPDAKKAWAYVGGGITASSQPEKEWEETRAKSETMKRVFS